ncbi:hypothetical protein HA402_011324 [Bradysia odoriphaga]|nr:hypothetical protein HA402_011324 [Bradysia odoriphaga]
MYVQVLLILWTTVLATTLVQTQSFDPPDCSTFDDFPIFANNPINCRAYWFCGYADAEPIPDYCPDGYNFNEGKQLCDTPEEYPCTDPEDPGTTDPTTVPTDPTDETEQPTTDATTTVRPPPSRNVCEGLPNGRLVNDPTLCRAFFECQNEVALPRQCDVGLNFNEELQICDRPSFTPCSNDEFECPFFGISRWEVPGSCNEYNYCFAGQHRVQTCAEGLLFDSAISLCALEENVKCERDLCPITNDIDNIVTYPSENDCEQYYKCYDNNRELQFCAPGTHWNQANQRCERPEDANCELATEPPTGPPTEETTEPSTDPPTDPPTTEPPFEIECEPAEEPFLLPHPFVCQNYFLCVNTGGV